MRSPWAGPAATVGMAIAYVLAMLQVLPQLFFFPRLGTWGFHAIDGEPSIRWYGCIAWALLGGVVAGGLAEVTRVRVPWRLALLVPLLALIGLAVAQYQWFGF
jgi:hypothetical protein